MYIKLQTLWKCKYSFKALLNKMYDYAMDEYIQNQSVSSATFDSWKPVSLGGLKEGAKDWLSKDYQDEMLGSAF